MSDSLALFGDNGGRCSGETSGLSTRGALSFNGVSSGSTKVAIYSSSVISLLKISSILGFAEEETAAVSGFEHSFEYEERMKTRIIKS